ncbi:MAG: LuxR C-terminal-related transcriptional regulator [Actinomycetota bacterium]|nr:LuxR C-terminal-related transcriptional regulator [Actinomycetota bacterium]
MNRTGTWEPRGALPLLLVSLVTVLVTFGFSQGLWISNLHNGLLALAFAAVGAYVLFQRPGHREGVLFMATALVESVLFLGRQVGHSSAGAIDRWWAWLGVWPVVVALALTTLAVICFPDGHLPSARWQWVVAGVATIATACAALSALWPVEYSSAGVTSRHPLNPLAPAMATHAWSVLAHPAYVTFQVLWVVAVVARWRAAEGHVRRQLTWLVTAAGISAITLVGGLAFGGTARPGILAATIIPLAAGWAIVHGQHTAAYSALTWLSRSDPHSADLPGDFAKAVAQALNARSAILWMGPPDDLQAIGVWPETDGSLAPGRPRRRGELVGRHVRTVSQGDHPAGAISIDRAERDPLSLAEIRLLDDLSAQAGLVIEHQGLADVIARQRRAGLLEDLSPREQEVLELLARGMSNAAIGRELHLSIKTVEPVISATFVKLGLHHDVGSNRRVLAALAYLRA